MSELKIFIFMIVREPYVYNDIIVFNFLCSESQYSVKENSLIFLNLSDLVKLNILLLYKKPHIDFVENRLIFDIF